MEYTTTSVKIKGGTIEALIRLHNKFRVTKDQLAFLVDEFNKLNPEAQPPKIRQTVLVPVLKDIYEKAS